MKLRIVGIVAVAFALVLSFVNGYNAGRRSELALTMEAVSLVETMTAACEAQTVLLDGYQTAISRWIARPITCGQTRENPCAIDEVMLDVNMGNDIAQATTKAKAIRAAKGHSR